MYRSPWHLFFVGNGLEPEVRVWGARGALPGADIATRASGRGRRGTQPRCRQGPSPGTPTGHRHNTHHVKTSFVYLTKEVFYNDIRSLRNGCYIFDMMSHFVR